VLNISVFVMKFSRAISRVRWFSFVETDVSKTISVLLLRVVELMRTRTKMVFETFVSTKLNHLTLMITRENFIILTRRESIKSYFKI
jgi:hypothetical protein